MPGDGYTMALTVDDLARAPAAIRSLSPLP